MSSKGKILRKFSLRRSILPIVILCTSVWWAPPETHAQEAAPTALYMTANSTLWSLEGPGSNNAPSLVIGMADRGDTPSYGSLRIGPDSIFSARFAGAAGPPGRDIVFPADGFVAWSSAISAHETIQRSPDLASAKVYRLLDDRSGPFLYGYQANYPPSKQRLAENESFTREVVQAPRPLFELEFGSWRLPVMLSGSAVSR
jgi:hypothetical protein